MKSVMVFFPLLKQENIGSFIYLLPKNCKTLSISGNITALGNDFNIHLPSKYQKGCMNETHKSYFAVYSGMIES